MSERSPNHPDLFCHGAAAWCEGIARVGPACALGFAMVLSIVHLPSIAMIVSRVPGLMLSGRGPAPALLIGLGLLGVAVHQLLGAPDTEADARRRRMVRWGGGLVLALGSVKFAEHLMQGAITFDNLLFLHDRAEPGTLAYLSPLPALNFALLGASVLLLTFESHERSIWLAQGLASASVFIGFVGLTGFLYGEQPLRSTGFLLPMGLGLVCVRPRHGMMQFFNAATTGGSVLRRLPLFVLLLEAMDCLEWQGERRKFFTAPTGQVVQAAAGVLLLGLLVWSLARRLHQKDLQQQIVDEALRSSEERYRNLVDRSPLAIIVKAPRRIEFANPAAQLLLGAENPEQIINRQLADFLPPRARKDMEAAVDRVIRYGMELARIEQRIIQFDGAERDVELSISPVEIQGRRLAQVQARDVTAQRQALAALQASEERFRVTFEQAAVGMAIASLDGRFLRVNSKFCAIVGYSPSELEARTFLEITHPDDFTLNQPLVQQLVAGTIPDYSLEKRYVRKDGTPVWVHVTVGLVRDADKSPHHFVGLIEDVSERRNLETQLRHIQKMDAIGELAGGVAHDFNNMLTVILGNASLVKLDQTLQPSTLQSLEDIVRATQRAGSLTRQLLLFSRREAMQPGHHDLNQLIRDVARMLQRLLGEGVVLRLQLEPRPLPGYVDAGMIDQVLVNLAINARDAMNGRGELAIETMVCEIGENEVRQQAEATPGRYGHVRVSDTGTGIAPKILPRIFEPFFTTKKVGKGTGLGLATTYGILKQHRGWITAGNTLGGGATFDLFLPLAVPANEKSTGR